MTPPPPPQSEKKYAYRATFFYFFLPLTTISKEDFWSRDKIGIGISAARPPREVSQLLSPEYIRGRWFPVISLDIKPLRFKFACYNLSSFLLILSCSHFISRFHSHIPIYLSYPRLTGHFSFFFFFFFFNPQCTNGSCLIPHAFWM